MVDAEVPADSVALAEAAGNITTEKSERTSVSRFGTWHSRAADGAAVAGLSDTVEALADGRAAEVFIAYNPSSDACLWTGSGGAELSMTADALASRGAAPAVRDRADAVIARAVACTDTELVLPARRRRTASRRHRCHVAVLTPESFSGTGRHESFG